MKTALECTIWWIHFENFLGEDPQAPLPNRKWEQFRQSSIHGVGLKPCKLDKKKKNWGHKDTLRIHWFVCQIFKKNLGCMPPNPPNGASPLWRLLSRGSTAFVSSPYTLVWPPLFSGLLTPLSFQNHSYIYSLKTFLHWSQNIANNWKRICNAINNKETARTQIPRVMSFNFDNSIK